VFFFLWNDEGLRMPGSRDPIRSSRLHSAASYRFADAEIFNERQ